MSERISPISLRAPFFILIVSLCFFARTSGQEIRSSAPASSQPTSVNEPYSYPRIILALCVVVGLILLLKWGSSKVAPGISPKSGKAMSVLSRLPLGPRQQLVLIKVGRRAVLLGHAGSQMNPICEITDAEELAHLVGETQSEKSTPPLGAFASLFKKRESEFDPTPREVAAVTEPEENEQLAQLARRELLGLSERVRGLSQEMNI